MVSCALRALCPSASSISKKQALAFYPLTALDNKQVEFSEMPQVLG